MKVRGAVVTAVLVLGMAVPVAGQVGIPDPSLMNGQALPAPELPDGTVTVRVMRETVGNDAAGETAGVTVNGVTQTATTDVEGRAEFGGLPAGATGIASALVDGEELTSAPFTVPASGGLRVILISGVRTASPALAVSGTVVLGPGSRIIAQFQEDQLQVFYLLEVINERRQPVDLGGPLQMELPQGAAGASVMTGSTPTTIVSGDLLTVTGPFQSGTTPVQVAFTLPHSSPNLTIAQTWPVPVDGLSFGIETVGDLAMASEQFLTTGQIRANDGTPYFLGDIPPLPADATIEIQLTGLPVASTLPRNIALTLVALIFGVGTWVTFRGEPEVVTRAKLRQQRDTLLGDLVQLEGRRREGRLSARDAARRDRLVRELEQIYAALDQVGPQGGGEDLAA